MRQYVVYCSGENLDLSIIFNSFQVGKQNHTIVLFYLSLTWKFGNLEIHRLGEEETLVNSRELHGITNRGNPAITSSDFYRGSSGNGDSYLEINIDYRVKTMVTTVMGTISVVLPW